MTRRNIYRSFACRFLALGSTKALTASLSKRYLATEKEAGMLLLTIGNDTTEE
jgi:hypothetical protein